MILQKKTINNVPTLVPLTADTGSGAPLGTIHGFYKKGNYAGYLYLDGSTFDETLYPALYAYLGTNVLPDYREFVLVGAEQNTTSATIATHDVFTQGEEKDDQLQDHTHWLIQTPNTSFLTGEGNYKNVPVSEGTIQTGVVPGAYRNGATTRTKEKAVFWYIKATTGISESEATDVLNVFNNRMFPDYAHPITIPAANSWTATEDCYVMFHWITLGGGSNALYLDGDRVDTWDSSTYGDVSTYSVSFNGYIKKGQVLSLASGFNFSSNSFKAFPLGS